MRKDPLKPVHDWYSRRKTRKAAALLAGEDAEAMDRFMRYSDHGLFRARWTNMAQIAPGIWRSNHPPVDRFARLKEMGIKTILSLRGPQDGVPHRRESQLCAQHGIAFHSLRLDARRAPQPEPLLEALAFLRDAERPVLFHCKSGADRAGLVAALYLLVVENRPMEEARQMLSPRFLHFRRSRTGVLDLFLDRLAAAQAATGVSFEDWVTTQYDPQALQAEFDAR